MFFSDIPCRQAFRQTDPPSRESFHLFKERNKGKKNGEGQKKENFLEITLE
jgi:hypothetical protein